MKFFTYIFFFFLSFQVESRVTTVQRVIDGDTFVTLEGEKVRMIGINAPEKADIYGRESKNYLKSLIEDKQVTLMGDALNNDTDRYGRLLRYVLLNSVDINKKMISDGYAFAYLTYKFSKSSEYRMAQIESRDNMLGMWGGKKSKTKIINDIDNDFFDKRTFIIILSISLLSLGIFYSLKK